MTKLALMGAAALLAYPGMYITKDAPPAEASVEALSKELSEVTQLLKTAKDTADQHYKDLHNHYNGVKSDNEDLKKTVEQHAKEYAELTALTQQLTSTVDMVKKQLDAPINKGGSELADVDRKNAIELQRRLFISKGGEPKEFKADLDNLVDMNVYRRVAQKMTAIGLETPERVIRSFDESEKKAFEAAGLDNAFFMPELLGLEIDCNVECGYLLDMYGQVSVTKSSYLYPRVESYGDIGKYDCDAKCDAEYGPEGNIRWLNGQTYDWRGVFCLNKKVLAESNYDFLDFMIRSIQRSYRINRNRALIVGDGVNEPQGWLTADCFKRISTPQRVLSEGGSAAPSFNHVDFRRFLSTAPIEYGQVLATMHQNMFAYLAASTDNNGRFIFGDGEMTFSPDDTRERIRISNCLPDATEDNTRGSAANPFVPGAFLAAAANWDMAYKAVNKKPMFMEQYIGGSSAWCVKYQFGAEDGSFIGCCEAGRVLEVG